MYRIESINGVTEGPYESKAKAERAAKRFNSIAPWQQWRAVPEDEITPLHTRE